MKPQDSNTTKLLTVEDTFLIEGRGIVLMPEIPVASYNGPGSFQVTVRKPDGEALTALAELQIPRVNPTPPELYFLCLLKGFNKADVPIGSEIWDEK